MKIIDAIGITLVGPNVMNVDPELSAHEMHPAFKVVD
jgi:hypothetical protein